MAADLKFPLIPLIPPLAWSIAVTAIAGAFIGYRGKADRKNF
jgi:hypothetical protein